MMASLKLQSTKWNFSGGKPQHNNLFRTSSNSAVWMGMGGSLKVSPPFLCWAFAFFQLYLLTIPVLSTPEKPGSPWGLLILQKKIYTFTIFLLWLKLQHRWRWRPIFQRQHNPNALKGKDGGAEEERELVWGRLGSRRNSGFPVMMKRKRILVMMIDNLSRRREAYYWWGEGGRRRDSRRQPLEPKPEHFM